MLEMLLTSSALILLLTLLRVILKTRFSPRLRYTLWLLVALRLLIPGSLFTLPFSLPSLMEESGLTDTVEEVRYAPETVYTYGTNSNEYSPEEYISAVEDTEWFQSSWDSTAPVKITHAERSSPEDITQFRGDPDHAYMNLEVETYPDHFEPLKKIRYAGMVVMALWFLAANLRFRRKLKHTALPADVDAPLPVKVAPDLISPCLCGELRPTIYVTPACVADETRLRHVIAHEYAHYRQGDHVWSLVRCLCLVVWWFNPLVWVAAALSRRDCELACDAAAIRRLGEEQRIPYGRTLVDMVASTQSPTALLHTATTMTGGKKSLAERVALIARRPKMTLLTLLAVVLLTAFAAACAFGGADTGEDDAAKELAAQIGDTVQLFSVQEGEESFVLLSWDGVEAQFDWPHITPRGCQMEGALLDIDGDGADELAVSVVSGTGTGVSVQDLYIVEMADDRTSLSEHRLPEEQLALLTEMLTCAADGTDITFSIEDQTLTVSAEGTVDTFPHLSEYVSFAFSENGIRMTVGIPVRYTGSAIDFFLAELSANILFSNGQFGLSDYRLSPADTDEPDTPDFHSLFSALASPDSSDADCVQLIRAVIDGDGAADFRRLTDFNGDPNAQAVMDRLASYLSKEGDHTAFQGLVLCMDDYGAQHLTRAYADHLNGAVSAINDYFAQIDINGFLCSLYNKGSEADLYEALYLYGQEASLPDDICPRYVLTADEISEALRLRLGLSVDKNWLTANFPWEYDPDTDSFYHLHGDTNYRTVICYHLTEKDGIYTALCYVSGFGLTTATLKDAADGGYQFLSHTLAISDLPPTTPALSVTAREYLERVTEEELLAFVAPAAWPGKEFSSPAELTSYDLFTIAAFSADYAAWYDGESGTHLIPVTDLTTILDGLFEDYHFDPADTGWGRYNAATGIHTTYFMDLTLPAYTLRETYVLDEATFRVVLDDGYTGGVTIGVRMTEEGPRIVECRYNGTAQGIAQAAWDYITGSDFFYMDVYTETDETRILLNDGNTWNLPSDLSGYEWAHTTSQGSGTAMTIRLSSPDGKAEVRCFYGSDRVRVLIDGKEYYFTADDRYDEDVDALFRSTLNAAGNTLIYNAHNSIVIDGRVSDHGKVVEEYARRYAANLNALPDWVPGKPNSTVYNNASVSQAYFGEGTENFCGGFSLYLSPEMGMSPYWQAGSGMTEETRGEYAGWWLWGMGADFARNTDGDWYCTGHYTGGESLIFPTKLENATLEELVYYFYHTTPGHAHNYLIPYYICRHPVTTVEELYPLLAQQEDPTALMSVLYQFIAQYGIYSDVNFTLTELGKLDSFTITDGYVQIPEDTLTVNVVSKNGVSIELTQNGVQVGSLQSFVAPQHFPSIEQGQLEFENGQLSRFWSVADHFSYTDHRFIEGCSAPAVIAHSLYAPPYEDESAGSTSWVICFAEESGYLHYRMTLNADYFTREEAMELALSVTFGYNAFLIPNYTGGR